MSNVFTFGVFTYFVLDIFMEAVWILKHTLLIQYPDICTGLEISSVDVLDKFHFCISVENSQIQLSHLNKEVQNFDPLKLTQEQKTP